MQLGLGLGLGLGLWLWLGLGLGPHSPEERNAPVWVSDINKSDIYLTFDPKAINECLP